MKELPEANTSLKGGGFFPYIFGIISIAWLPVGLSSAIAGLFQPHLAFWNLIVTAIGGVLFVGIYLWGIWGNIQYMVNTVPPIMRVKTSVWVTVGVLTALSIIMVDIGGYAWGSLFIFTCSYAAGRLPTVQAIWIVVGLLLITVIGGLRHHFAWFEFGQALFLISFVGTAAISMVRSYWTSQELRVAKAEIAHLAVTTERLRIARDLHDLLGHSLSLIALKSELAGRLIGAAPEQAAIEIGDVEQVARATLQQVREAVGSYRQPTLASELQSAEEILNAAGIAYRYEGDEHSRAALPGTIEGVFAWTVREGVTNVIRHSRAHQCVIRIKHTEHEGCVEIIDDGMIEQTQGIGQGQGIGQAQDTAVWSDGVNRVGNGLRGLSERVESLGGWLDAGPNVGGGFRLAVSIPLVQKAERSNVATASPGRPTERSEQL